MSRLSVKTTLLALSAALVGILVGAATEKIAFDKSDVESAERLIGLSFTDAERDSMMDDLRSNLEDYENLRAITLSNRIPPSLLFEPLPTRVRPPNGNVKLVTSPPARTSVPENLEELAFYSVRELAELIRTGKITSTQLTQIYIERLQRFGPQLECVVTLTEELALAQARHADEEIAAGRYRGYLHGIPYGAKDLLSVPGYKTTWGAQPYKDQVIDETATVIKKLENAGAVLVAKLTLGALAWGDVWFGGMTRNPWNLEQGSSGSSAGSAAATAAGLVAFAIGTETWGSIVSPSTRCGATGLRPTFGSVSRTGAMALSWSMDKIGPICRTAEDCAIVYEVIRGPDGIDQSVVETSFVYDFRIDLKDLRIGYLREAFEEDYSNHDRDAATLVDLRELGAKLIPIDLPDYPVSSLSFILTAEAAAAFDDLTRSNRDDLLVRQIKNAWPNVLRSSRFIPAVEYIQANRLRYEMIQGMHQVMADVDVYVCPTFGGNNLLLTNLTGHPCVVLPNGFNEKGAPTSITFIGNLYDEATLLAVANAYQQVTNFHQKHPPAFTPQKKESQ
jgi:Asp-tRNA(Asn)/Glu-tRNA(Gln) amidotransferase A subunit family amidase